MATMTQTPLLRLSMSSTHPSATHMQCQLVVGWPFDSKLTILVGFLVLRLTFCT
jgi:hypothetical protein